MKYFSIETFVNAYRGFQDSMTNKSWGYLALLKGCKDSIRASVPYEVDLDTVSNFLEEIFNLSQEKKKFDSGRSLYVVFSNKWEDYFNDQGRYSPDIYDVIVWAYRRRPFADDITNDNIIAMFAKEFNIPLNIIANSFNSKAKVLTFTSSLYSENQLKATLGKFGVDVSKNNIDAKKSGVVASPGEISRGPFVQTLYAGLDITDYVLILQSDYYSLYGNGKNTSKFGSSEKKPLQQIFYGAPGTGKSHEVKKQTGELSDDGEDKNLPNVFRTTFHPDTDYASFVGCYKPSMRKTGKKHQVDGKDVDDEEIIYEYIPQTFTDAYVYAYKNPTEQTYLVIEEINRGNCAQIFGDLFQLLDRKNGVSEYRIKADKDLAIFLNEELGKDADGIKDGKLCLPANLNILATMNTSDQSLFPMDSAFKRRWEWKYIKIADAHKNWKIETNGEDWYEFIKQINKIINNMTSSADKQLGYFFCQANEEKDITTETFVSKVLFYLWNDVFKDYGFDDESLFKYKTENGKEEDLTFPDFYDEDGNVVPDVVKQFIEHVMVWKGDDKKENN